MSRPADSKLVRIGDFNFRFECQPGCVACCTQQGEVYLTAQDVVRIAQYLELTPKQFEKRYMKRRHGDLMLTIPADRDCHFLLQGGCSIHAVKPVQCKTFPFWPDNVKDRRSWKALKAYCPGVGAGGVLDRTLAREQAQECLDAFPKG